MSNPSHNPNPSVPDRALPVTRPVRLNPVPADYAPAYPRRLTADEIEQFLRPGLFRRFSPATMMAGAVIAAALSGGCDGESDSASAAAPGGTGASGAGKSTRTDPQLRAKVEQIALEVLGPYRARMSWNDDASLCLEKRLSSNPPVKTPSIPISYGNSYVGLFDTNAAKEATRRMFAAYGIELEASVKVKGDGFEFIADGYDPRRRVGFKLLVPGGRTRLADNKPVAGPASEVLAAEELPALDEAVKSGTVNVFVADATDFPNMDGDQFTAMEYYLASVVDYLNWVHGDRTVELNKVLGKLPGAARKRHHREQWPPLPGGDFEADEDLKRWRATDGKVSISREWSGFGERGLLVELEPGGSVTYTPPEDEPLFVRPDFLVFRCDLYCPDLAAARAGTNITVTLIGEDDRRAAFVMALGERWARFEWAPGSSRRPPFKRLHGLTITTDSRSPIRFYVDDLAVQMKRPGDPDEPPRPKTLEEREKEREEAERQARVEVFKGQLARPLPEVEFDDTPLADVLQFLRDVTALNLCVDRPALRAAGIDLNTRVSLRCQKVPVADVLHRALAVASPQLRHGVLGDGVLLVSTESALQAPREILLPDRGGDATANAVAGQALRRPLPHVHFENAHFADVVDFLKDVTNLDVRVDWPRLKEAGVRPDAPVHMELSRVRVDEVLQLVIRDAAGDAPVSVAVWDGKLVIGTAGTFEASSPPDARTVAASDR